MEVKMETYDDMKKVVEERKKLTQERIQLHSKKRLISVLTTKFKTVMIGSLASFEKHFGHLWGQNKDDSCLTPEQKENRALWLQLRNEVLDRGNNQLRAAIDEVANYTFNWNKYQVQLMVRKNYE